MPASDDFLRPLKSMHKVFALSTLLMFAAVIWMFVADYDDQWRGYQKEFAKVEAVRLDLEEEELTSQKSYQERIAELEAEQQAANEKLAERSDQIAEVQGEMKELGLELNMTGRRQRAQNALRDVARANYDLAIRDEAPQEELKAKLAAFEEQNQKANDLLAARQRADAAYEAAKGRLQGLTRERDEYNSQMKVARSEVDRIKSARFKVEPDNWFSSAKRSVMEWPIIDGFNSPLKIQQDWLPELHQTLGMTSTARFDRCRTCHQAIDRIGAGNVPSFPHGDIDSDHIRDWVVENKYPHPYATHPKMDLYLSATSPHPLPTFGCTICHEGQGSGTSFANAAHGPNDPHELEVWADEHGFFENHFWEYPMYPKRFVEATCIKCHHNVVELGVNPKFGASAPKVFRGYELVKTYGCFGCHEINGYDGDKPIGPDLRLEPNYAELAKAILGDEALRKTDSADQASKSLLSEIRQLAEAVLDEPERTAERDQLQSLIQEDQVALKEAVREVNLGEKQSLGTHLDSRTHALGANLTTDGIVGEMRKVGPSLRHVAAKTTPEWMAYWTEDPKRFRPSTRMPQFFHLTNQEDEIAGQYQPVEIAGIVSYLMGKSAPMEMMTPAEDYTPNVERGQQLFSQRGCLACHQHEKFPQSKATFGPDLTKEHAKVKPGKEGFGWLYTWLRNPELYHARTKMPNLFLEPQGAGEKAVDPAADIAAFLLQGGYGEYPQIAFNDDALEELVRLNLSKAIDASQVDEVLTSRTYPVPRDLIKGDEIELFAEGEVSDEQWHQMKLNYVGRRTISRYGCYGCHDVPGFEAARPIGTALQDWGRKDTSKLAAEHIEEFLHHHGEPDGSSTHDVVERAMRLAQQNEFSSEEEREENLRTAYFYESLIHHGRPGFLWQKLRAPRSYDYHKIETKGYDERLRMPKFPFSQDDIEDIATFVLGLVAEPPSEQYVYRPSGVAGDRIEGERLLEKFNCTSCHMVDLPEIQYAVNPDDLVAPDLADSEYPPSLELLRKLKPAENGLTDKTVDGKPVIKFHGLVTSLPDPEEEPEYQEYAFDLWQTLKVGDKELRPSTRMLVPAKSLVSQTDGRGGDFANWLVGELMQTTTNGNRSLAWQASPPPLYQEGIKVQTPWLFKFLRNPMQLRHTTVLRMPQFNMSEAEAQSLANYFAAVDHTDYPYQQITQRNTPYLEHRAEVNDLPGPEAYLDESWKVLNAPLCIKCHSVGGRQVTVSDPKTDIRGPNLELTVDRLRPDWLMLWLYKPQWITPYTSMPQPLPRGKVAFPELFGGDPETQTISLRDALMNYHRLMESQGKLVYQPTVSDGNAGQGGE